MDVVVDTTKAQRIGKRQVHLDFHTSEHFPEIGKRFSKKQFQEALQAANLDGINIFAKCHHSWSYYPTEVGQMHPNLDFDLLGAQIEAWKLRLQLGSLIISKEEIKLPAGSSD